MKEVKLGSPGLVIPTIGIGCMGMTEMMGQDTPANVTNLSSCYKKTQIQ